MLPQTIFLSLNLSKKQKEWKNPRRFNRWSTIVPIFPKPSCHAQFLSFFYFLILWRNNNKNYFSDYFLLEKIRIFSLRQYLYFGWLNFHIFIFPVLVMKKNMYALALWNCCKLPRKPLARLSWSWSCSWSICACGCQGFPNFICNK